MDEVDAAIKRYDPTFLLKEKQREALFHLASGKGDLVVNLPVGYGKSLIYHVLPDLLGKDIEKPVVLVISPLNVIQSDQVKSLAKHNISACRLDISGETEEHEEEEEDGEHYRCVTTANIDHVKEGKYQVVLCHPEALFNTKNGRQLLRNQFKEHVVAVVVDECHLIEKWGKEFRTAFNQLKDLKSFFTDVPLIALSGTLTQEQVKQLPLILGLSQYFIISTNPDKSNVFLEKIKKDKTNDSEQEYNEITRRVCDQLFIEKENFPVTLLFIPVFYMSKTLEYLKHKFGPHNIENSMYSAICSGQDKYVIDTTVEQLKLDNPRIRLVLTTSMLGMGFDPKNVTNIIHACPPRNLSQYFQEIGRAGRQGQPAKATLYYSARNIAKNLPGICDDIISYCSNDDSCLRNKLLSVFGFEKESNITGCKCCSFCKCDCWCEDCEIWSLMNIDIES